MLNTVKRFHGFQFYLNNLKNYNEYKKLMQGVSCEYN